MRFQGLDLNLLVAFDTLAEHRSVSLAAEAMHLSQSAMSAALARLRAYFDDELLVPRGRTLVLTPRAEQLAPEVRDTLLRIHATIAHPAAFDPIETKREFTIVASDYVQAVLLEPFMRKAAHHAPGMRFRILPISQQGIDEFKRGVIDLIIVADSVILPEHPSQKLFEDEAKLICSADHPTIGDEISMEQFGTVGHVTTSLHHHRPGSLFDLMLLERSIARRIEIQVPAFSMMAGAVVGTERVAILHARLATSYARILPIKLLSLPFALPPIREVIQWHALRQRDRGLQWLLEALTSEAAAL
ncbi:transcriptional regulator, LysR family [Rhizorhabdus wittichii RW1]|uniref:Transcriptional regulator, LysR family n=1 Tax=Rhizorhabdus wittichii (strain DSM 6014 / CCUG 31198 / JCM 15750 / NBRC 105917 / EY 4224 / RW1) TaxID=392499 RepID=A0A9J9HAB3_RHIWR|nr:transcriptional regulator, LysR family [Rhizorhabdus wittichii RW1]